MTVRSILQLADFEEEKRAEAEQAVERIESYTREELDAALAEAVAAAREAAYEDGRKAGEAQMLQSIEQRQTAVAEQLVPEISRLTEEQAAYCALLEDEMTGFMREFCEKLFPEFAREFGRDRLMTELAHVSRRALGSPWLEVRVPPGLGEVADRIVRPEGAEVDLKVIEDPALGGTSACASWKNGRSEYDFEKLCGDILALLSTPKS
ncbi:hypothetical protein AB9K35_18250 [Leisingera sp. XS_AS12]|uniref:hypothetical protein n=1 Tax=Leisingera sp. XS_AS12 TaxID=3241294 RepID=UPI00351363DE